MIISCSTFLIINCGDSLSKHNENLGKYDFVVANPPYGIKGLDYTTMFDK
jgi:type I restriction-modification system DNA methylase subunit